MLNEIDLVILIPALLALAIFCIDMYLRLKLEKEKFKFLKMQHDEEKKARDEQREWLNRESIRLTNISIPIAENIARELKSDIGWAFESLEKAKLGQYSQSIFGERLAHFAEEKKYITEQFVPLLLKRCKHLISQGKKIYLLIDSGTTLYPFFEKLTNEALQASDNNEEWLANIQIVTNNLPGIQKMMEISRNKPKSRYSTLALNSFLLPGVPFPEYSAVYGDQTVNTVEQIKKEAVNLNPNSVFISLVVGNWIILKKGTPSFPQPLARVIGHTTFKKSLIENSDEIYIVTPLGKVFCDVSEKQLNNDLGFSEKDTRSDHKPYSGFHINHTKLKYIKIVTTSRKSGRILHDHFSALKELLSFKEEKMAKFARSAVGKTPHMIFPFDKLPDVRYQEYEIELPHGYTRNEKFVKTYFHTTIN